MGSGLGKFHSSPKGSYLMNKQTTRGNITFGNHHLEVTAFDIKIDGNRRKSLIHLESFLCNSAHSGARQDIFLILI